MVCRAGLKGSKTQITRVTCGFANQSAEAGGRGLQPLRVGLCPNAQVAVGDLSPRRAQVARGNQLGWRTRAGLDGTCPEPEWEPVSHRDQKGARQVQACAANLQVGRVIGVFDPYRRARRSRSW